MNILFLGYAVDSETASGLAGSSVSCNRIHINILRELSKYSDIQLNSVTVYPVAPFPRNQLYFSHEMIPVVGDVTSTRVGFLNIPVIKQLCQTLAVYRQGKKILKANKDTIILTVNLFPQIGLPLMWLKKRFKVKTCCILADLPIDENYNRKGPSVLLRRLFDHFTLKAIAACDTFIALNEFAVKTYAPGKEYIIMEGGIDLSEVQAADGYGKSGIKNIVYSGALTEFSGVKNLITAMKDVTDQTIELHIYGSGVLTEEIKALILQSGNKNIKYLGCVKNDEMKRIQSRAWLLANPRPIDDPIAKVTFPSKMFEYTISGTPVLSTRLNGFSEAYYDKMFFVEDNRPETLAAKINEIACLPPEKLYEKAEAAKNFMVTHKTWEIQCRRMYEFLSKIQKKD